MRTMSIEVTETKLRELMEYCYDKGRVKDAIILGNQLDQDQCLQIQNMKKKIFRIHASFASMMRYTTIVTCEVLFAK